MVRCDAQRALAYWGLRIEVWKMEGDLEIAKQGSGHGVRLSADKGESDKEQIMQAAEC